MTFKRLILAMALLLALVLPLAGCGAKTPAAENQGDSSGSAAVKDPVILYTTTSTVDSGLLDELLPVFEQESGYKVKPIGVGTGQALAMADQGEADAVLVHAPAAEEELVTKGSVINRQLVMHNDFIIVGPPADPAGIKEAPSAADAFKQIAGAQSLFVSRGDDSGTHKQEQKIWKTTGLTPAGAWYQEAGTGMGSTLNMASEKGAYTLTDRATYLALKDKLALEIVLEGDPILLNIYHVMQGNPDRFDRVNAEGGKAFVEFMVAPKTQAMIGDFGKDKFGESLFIPDAGKDPTTLGLPAR